jgi:hypothetical protein
MATLLAERPKGKGIIYITKITGRSEDSWFVQELDMGGGTGTGRRDKEKIKKKLKRSSNVYIEAASAQARFFCPVPGFGIG